MGPKVIQNVISSVKKFSDRAAYAGDVILDLVRAVLLDERVEKEAFFLR